MNLNTGDLLKSIIGVLVRPTTQLNPIPKQLLMIGGKMRSGLSARKITERTLQRLASEGIPVASVYGKDNLLTKMIQVWSEEMVNAIITEGKVETVVDPGAIQVTTVGGNAGGPVIAQGMNTNIVSTTGVMS